MNFVEAISWKGNLIINFSQCVLSFLATTPKPSGEISVLPPLPVNPCVPRPCGPNSLCQVVSNQAQCACLPGTIGVAPNCRPECSAISDCPSNKNCINNRCVDPCPGTCAAGAQCRVINHTPVCSCREGYTGNAYSTCKPIPVVGKAILNCWPRKLDIFFYSLTAAVLPSRKTITRI